MWTSAASEVASNNAYLMPPAMSMPERRNAHQVCPAMSMPMSMPISMPMMPMSMPISMSISMPMSMPISMPISMPMRIASRDEHARKKECAPGMSMYDMYIHSCIAEVCTGAYYGNAHQVWYMYMH